MEHFGACTNSPRCTSDLGWSVLLQICNTYSAAAAGSRWNFFLAHCVTTAIVVAGENLWRFVFPLKFTSTAMWRHRWQ